MNEVYNDLFTRILKAESEEEISDLVKYVTMTELTAEQKDQLLALGMLALTSLFHVKLMDDCSKKIADLSAIIQNLTEIKLHQ